MANMSYCRFQNTASDFADCLNALREDGLNSLSQREFRYAKSLRDLCQEYLDEFENAEEYFDENETGEDEN